MFTDFICKTMELYVNDMLIQILKTIDHIKLIDAIFQIWKRYEWC